MSLTELRAEIDKKAEEEIRRVLEDARLQAKEIIAEADAKADGIRKERFQAMIEDMEEEAKSRLAMIRMDMKGEVLKRKQEWASKVLERARERVAEMVQNDGPDYAKLLVKLTLEGIAGLKGDKFVIQASPKDLEIIRRNLEPISERAAKIRHSEVQLETSSLSETVLGGIVVSTEDGAQSFNNTLDARLAVPQLTSTIYRSLFGTRD